jgi:hypothetical protein
VKRLAAVALALAAACGRTGPEPVAPAPDRDRCPIASHATPLLAGLPAAEVAALSRASEGGLAVVEYGCRGLRVLPACSAPGRYRTLAVAARRQKLALGSAAEVSLNAPPAPGSPELAAPQTIEQIVAGERVANADMVKRDALAKGCADATHFVRRIEIGWSKTSGDAAGATRCAAGDPLADAPPEGCAAPLRVELVPLDAPVPEHDAARPLPRVRCPGATVLSEGRCLPAAGSAPVQCAPGNAAFCREQCDRGDAGSCATLAWMTLTSAATKEDLEAAAKLAQKACDAGDLHACGDAAAALRGSPDPVEAAPVLKLYLTSCERGDAEACADLGELVEGPAAGEPDPAKAMRLFARGCAGGLAAACGRLAGYLGADGRRALEMAEARALSAEACDRGDAPACVNLGLWLMLGRGVAADPVRARALFERVCEGEKVAGCVNLGILYQHGMGVEQDFGRAASLYDKACKGGHAMGCRMLAEMMESALGRPRDLRGARELLERGCTMGEGESCNDLGVYHLEGRGIPQDLPQAVKLFEAACARGVPAGCHNLAERYDRGEGVAKDAGTAAKLHRAACAAGVAASCKR